MTTHILVPLDGSAFAETALPVAARLASEQDADLVLLGVGTVPESRAQNRDQHVELQEMLRRAAATVTAPVRVRTRIELLTDPVRGILQAAQEEHIDRIVMATHDRSDLTATFEGSVAAGVVDSGEVPVTLVYPPATV